MKRPMVTLFAVGIVIAAFVILSQDNQGPDTATAPVVPLDYSKPTFTTIRTIVCPMSLLLEIRAGYAPDKVADMFNSLWSRTEKAHELRCEELQPDIPVTGTHLKGDLGNSWVCRAAKVACSSLWRCELTNRRNGQSAALQNELAASQSTETSSSTVQTPAGSSATAGNLLVTTPSRYPIYRGAGVAASDSNGFGAIICRDSDGLAALSDFIIEGGKSERWADWADSVRTFRMRLCSLQALR